MQMVADSLVNLPWFLAFFAAAVGLTFVYVVVYTWVTPHEELKLIRENNLAAALAFAGSLIGFAMPLASAIAHSISLLDCIVWGIVALIVQLLTFVVVRLLMPQISKRIEAGELAAGVWLGAVSLTAGILNAASLTY